ncbi:hypothetical protein RRG08_058794 [Elysia crispata]|uniref:Uncharacterized protein n=1 Tax=Elysia crispata TaxID=231223 RepID=A0AAE0YWE2_9GAST|nr:hypothetical protein RRG08_058794 [Elysia crispata]
MGVTTNWPPKGVTTNQLAAYRSYNQPIGRLWELQPTNWPPMGVTTSQWPPMGATTSQLAAYGSYNQPIGHLRELQPANWPPMGVTSSQLAAHGSYNQPIGHLWSYNQPIGHLWELQPIGRPWELQPTDWPPMGVTTSQLATYVIADSDKNFRKASHFEMTVIVNTHKEDQRNQAIPADSGNKFTLSKNGQKILDVSAMNLSLPSEWCREALLGKFLLLARVTSSYHSVVFLSEM